MFEGRKLWKECKYNKIIKWSNGIKIKISNGPKCKIMKWSKSMTNRKLNKNDWKSTNLLNGQKFKETIIYKMVENKSKNFKNCYKNMKKESIHLYVEN